MAKTAARHLITAALLAAFARPAACADPATADNPPGAAQGCEKVTCPAVNGEFALHLPNPVDCGSFCKCDWGHARYFACPPGLHFNQELQVCDWPANAGCQ